MLIYEINERLQHFEHPALSLISISEKIKIKLNCAAAEFVENQFFHLPRVIPFSRI